ncbi:MAG: YggS family pyridoxal phosphate-dependent enzyme [Oscillospiraceae bacterium]|jgi:pyridoxal phosphate enzyme (YggS family)|nr:YggS family pyridoxal phosphate-dependent enzyme [Oscillospiraceae bacterium]
MEVRNTPPLDTARAEGIRCNYLHVLDSVRECAVKYGRKPDEVRLMAVSKTVPAAEAAALLPIGSNAPYMEHCSVLPPPLLLGENKVQELCQKADHFRSIGAEAEIHLIGHLQSNKAAIAAKSASMIQSVDSQRIASLLSARASQYDRELPILLEVNIGRDPAHFGFLPEETESACAAIAALPHLKLRGLMAVPPFTEDTVVTERCFADLRELYEELGSTYRFDTLSMGMSGDYPLAIKHGSTLVRVGTAIFGSRNVR